MHLVVDRPSLQSALTLVQGIVERRNTVPILGHVLLEPEGTGLRLSATDLEVGIRTEVACRITEKGAITLNARKLFEVVREGAGEEVEMRSLEGDWIEVKCGRAKFKMMGLDPRSFPAMPGHSEREGALVKHKPVKGALKLGAAVLATMIDRTIFAVSPDEARYNLGGIFIESPAAGVVRMVATDGHRLSMVDRETEEFSMEGGATIPRKGLAELRKLLDHNDEATVRLVIDGQLAWLRLGTTEVSMRLVEGEFPDYRGVIPRESRYRITVGRDALLSAVKRAAIFSSERYHGVKLALSKDTLTISSTSPELGEASETIDVDFKGEDLAIGFNASYMIQALSAIPAEADTVLGLSDEASPGVLGTPADSQYTYVVMPMRL